MVVNYYGRGLTNKSLLLVSLNVGLSEGVILEDRVSLKLAQRVVLGVRVERDAPAARFVVEYDMLSLRLNGDIAWDMLVMARFSLRGVLLNENALDTRRPNLK